MSIYSIELLQLLRKYTSPLLKVKPFSDSFWSFYQFPNIFTRYPVILVFTFCYYVLSYAEKLIKQRCAMCLTLQQMNSPVPPCVQMSPSGRNFSMSFYVHSLYVNDLNSNNCMICFFVHPWTCVCPVHKPEKNSTILWPCVQQFCTHIHNLNFTQLHQEQVWSR